MSTTRPATEPDTSDSQPPSASPLELRAFGQDGSAQSAMRLGQFKGWLEAHPDHELRFILPDGDFVPAHAHITEAGRVDKTFIDCGGTVRSMSSCLLQAWVADDTHHRLTPGKLAGILTLAGPIFRGDDLAVEVEYEDCAISQFPVLSAETSDGALVFHLGEKRTTCLAMETCIPEGTCGSGSGCCS
jgi:hypothetical protein